MLSNSDLSENYHNPGRVFFSAANQVWPSYKIPYSGFIDSFIDYAHCEDIFVVTAGFGIVLRNNPESYWDNSEVLRDQFLLKLMEKGNWFFGYYSGSLSLRLSIGMTETETELQTFIQQASEFLMFIYILFDPSFSLYNQENNVYEPNNAQRRLQYNKQLFIILKSFPQQELSKFWRHLQFFKNAMSKYRQRTLHDIHKVLKTYLHKFDFRTFNEAMENLIHIIEHVIRP